MLDSTVYSQPALFVTSLAALESLRAESPEVVLACEAAAGLSLGEYTAMVFAGVMDFEDGLMLVQKRGARHAGSRRRHPQRHGQHPGPGARAGRGPLRRGPQRRNPANRQPALPGQYRDFRAPMRPVSGRPRLAPSLGAMKAVPLAVAGAFHTADHAAGRPALCRGLGRRAHAARREFR